MTLDLVAPGAKPKMGLILRTKLEISSTAILWEQSCILQNYYKMSRLLELMSLFHFIPGNCINSVTKKASTVVISTLLTDLAISTFNMLDSHSDLGIALIIFYIPVIVLAIYLACYRHIRPRMAWIIVIIFSVSEYYTTMYRTSGMVTSLTSILSQSESLQGSWSSLRSKNIVSGSR